MTQYDLDGNEIITEEIVTKKTLHTGRYFCLSVTDNGAAELDKLWEGGMDISNWIAKHMRVRNQLPDGNKGECFQRDMEQFKEKLEKRIE